MRETLIWASWEPLVAFRAWQAARARHGFPLWELSTPDITHLINEQLYRYRNGGAQLPSPGPDEG
jgi:hypothetical protein